MLFRDAEHIANDNYRETKRKISNEIRTPAWRHLVDRGVNDLLNPSAHILDPTGSKRLHYEPSQSGMIGRIQL
jgi:hypothetical protein